MMGIMFVGLFLMLRFKPTNLNRITNSHGHLNTKQVSCKRYIEFSAVILGAIC